MKNTALITGASSGLGKEFALLHAKRGGDLVLVARRREKLEALKSELEHKYQVSVEVIVQDLSELDSAEKIFRQLETVGIEVEVLINNAGFGGMGYFHERELERELQMIHVNVTSLTALTRLILPGMVARGRGKILNVSSTASLVPGPLQAIYYATKAFVTSFSYAISRELKGTGVSVTALLPGATETEFGQVSGMEKTHMFAKTSRADDVAKAGYDGMMNRKLRVVAGVTFLQRLSLYLLPFITKKMLLDTIFKGQQQR